MNHKKYAAVAIIPNKINGDSTCFAPNIINIIKLTQNTKKPVLSNFWIISLNKRKWFLYKDNKSI